MVKVLSETHIENIITIAQFPAGTNLKYISDQIYFNKKKLTDFSGCEICGKYHGDHRQNLPPPEKNINGEYYKNRLMDQIKIDANNFIWNQAATLLITNQTGAILGNETKPTAGQIIMTVTSDYETNRITGNPFYIAYQIPSGSAGGQWGSLCWIKSNDDLINRVRVSTKKQTDKVVFIELKAQLV